MSDRHLGKYMIDQVGGRLDHAPSTAAGTKPTSLAAERDQVFVSGAVALDAQEPLWPVGVPPSQLYGLLQNDLHLELEDPRGRRHLTWLLEAQQPNQPARRQSLGVLDLFAAEHLDHRNTIEQVEVDASELLGTWTLRVRAGRVLQSPQSFTLVSRSLRPAQRCGASPASFKPLPCEARLSLLKKWLLLTAVVLAVLVLMALWRVMRMAPNASSALGQALLMIAVLSAAGVLAFGGNWFGLAVFLGVALLIAVWLQPEDEPEPEGGGLPSKN